VSDVAAAATRSAVNIKVSDVYQHHHLAHLRHPNPSRRTRQVSVYAPTRRTLSEWPSLSNGFDLSYELLLLRSADCRPLSTACPKFFHRLLAASTASIESRSDEPPEPSSSFFSGSHCAREEICLIKPLKESHLHGFGRGFFKILLFFTARAPTLLRRLQGESAPKAQICGCYWRGVISQYRILISGIVQCR